MLAQRDFAGYVVSVLPLRIFELYICATGQKVISSGSMPLCCCEVKRRVIASANSVYVLPRLDKQASDLGVPVITRYM